METGGPSHFKKFWLHGHRSKKLIQGLRKVRKGLTEVKTQLQTQICSPDTGGHYSNIHLRDCD